MDPYQALQAAITYLRQRGIPVEGVEGSAADGWPTVVDLRFTNSGEALDAHGALRGDGAPASMAYAHHLSPLHVRVYLEPDNA